MAVSSGTTNLRNHTKDAQIVTTQQQWPNGVIEDMNTCRCQNEDVGGKPKEARNRSSCKET